MVEYSFMNKVFLGSSPVAISVYLKYIIWWEDKGLKHEKHFVGGHLSFFLKNCYGWLKLMTCSYTINTTEKKMTICKNNGWLSRQDRRKNPYFYCKQRSRPSSRHLTLKKSLKLLLQNIYVMLELLHHKHNPLITTDVYGSFFLKTIKIVTWE